MNKRIVRYKFILIVLVVVLLGTIVTYKKQQQGNAYFHVGIAVYNMDDTYMQEYIEELRGALEKYECSGKKVLYEILDAEGNWNRQQKQLQYMYSQNFDALFINLVKPAAAASILNQTAQLDIPVILFNREPEAKNLTISDNIWYVGTDAKAAGAIQGDMLSNLWKQQKTEVDRNKNGKLDYVLVEGEEAHFDAVRRTNGFLENSSDINLNQIANIAADWQRVIAYHEFSELDKEIVENIEAVVCHNDDMALGIYDYYEEHQMEKPVILGINNSSETNLYGTVDNNIEEQVGYMCNLLDHILKDQTEGIENVWYSKPYAVLNMIKR